MRMPKLTLVSHVLCPYVQRAAIVLTEKAAPFERRDVDLSNKPDWFLQISPLGKTPVLLADHEAIFESAVICEYLDDTLLPKMHPSDALTRAHHRAWMEFGSNILNRIAGFYNAVDAAALDAKRRELCARFLQVEAELTARRNDGPYFSGEAFCMVDAVFAPIFRYFDVFDMIEDFHVFDGLANVQTWRNALSVRPSVREAVVGDYPQKLMAFVRARGSELSRLAK